MPTKSVSQLSSTTAPVVASSETMAMTVPSLVARPAFLATAARPRVRRTSTAFSKSASASTSAFLHSIMPAPVISRSSLTREAVISATLFLSLYGAACAVPGWKRPRAA